MAYSHCTRTGLVEGQGKGSMGSNISWRNFDTDPTQGQRPGPIVSYCSTLLALKRFIKNTKNAMFLKHAQRFINVSVLTIF